MFTSNGIQFQTPFTTALDKSGIPVDPAMRDICTHDEATPETVAMAVKECADRHQALLEEWLKTNTPKVCKPGSVWREDLTARAKASKGSWLQAQMAAAAALKNETDRHAQRWDAHDAKGDDLEKAIAKERSESFRFGLLHKDAKVA